MSRNARTDTLPDPGPNRWWVVELVRPLPRSVNPIKVTLMESFDLNSLEGPKRPGSPVMYMLTVANPEAIRKTGEKILAAVGNYRELVGEYWILPRELEHKSLLKPQEKEPEK